MQAAQKATRGWYLQWSGFLEALSISPIQAEKEGLRPEDSWTHGAACDSQYGVMVQYDSNVLDISNIVRAAAVLFSSARPASLHVMPGKAMRGRGLAWCRQAGEPAAQISP